MENISPEHYFHMCSGVDLKNFTDLCSYFNKISHEEFNHHVTEDRNDFANWVRDILKKPDIADDLEKIKDLEEMKKYLKSCMKSKIPEKEKKHGIIQMIKEAIFNNG